MSERRGRRGKGQRKRGEERERERERGARARFRRQFRVSPGPDAVLASLCPSQNYNLVLRGATPTRIHHPAIEIPRHR